MAHNFIWDKIRILASICCKAPGLFMALPATPNRYVERLFKFPPLIPHPNLLFCIMFL